jgi:Ca-activated chloride channel homolog
MSHTTSRRRAPGAAPAPRRRPPVLARASSLVMALALVLGGLLGAPAHAAPSAAGPSEAPEGGQGSLQPVVVVMDYSSSMLEKDADASGTTRLAAAREATTSLLDNAPDGADLGMVVYGANTAGDCKDITTLQRVGPTDVGSLKQKIAGLDAVGETPIGAALLHAAEELEGIDGEKSIILVSDGEENCSEPPACEAAQDLAAQGIGLTVHTIGFKVNDAARDELTCVAEATGGTYVQADNASELQTELQTKTVRAFQGYVASGTPVTGGETLHSSPQLAPGQYLDEYGRGETSAHSSADGTLRFYHLGAIEPGERAHFSALLLPDQSRLKAQGDPFAGIEVQLVNGQGETCSSSDRDYSHSSDGGKPIVGYVRSKEYTEPGSYGCFQDGTGQLFAKVQRYGEHQADQPLPVELKFVVEPAVDESTLGPNADDEETPQSVALSATGRPVPGGGSFNEATEVENQTVLTDSVMPNEARYYRVHVGYGQRLNVRAANGSTEDAGPDVVDIDVFSSVRGPVKMKGDDRLHRRPAGQTVTLNMPVSVSMDNHDGSYGNDAYLSGDYYVVVSADKYSDDRNREPYPYELAIDVSGEEQDGPLIAEPGAGQVVEPDSPESADDAGQQGNGADDEATAESTAGAVPAGGPDEGGDGAEATAAGLTEPAGNNPLPWFLGGLAGSAVIGAAALAFTRRRPVPAPATTQQYSTPPYPGHQYPGSQYPDNQYPTDPEGQR